MHSECGGPGTRGTSHPSPYSLQLVARIQLPKPVPPVSPTRAANRLARPMRVMPKTMNARPRQPRSLADRRGRHSSASSTGLSAPAAPGAHLRLVLACCASGFRRQGPVFDNLNAPGVCVAAGALLDPCLPYKINRILVIDKIKRQIGRWPRWPPRPLTA